MVIVTDDLSMAESFAEYKGGGNGAVVYWNDSELKPLGLPVGDKTKNDEGYIPFEFFDKIPHPKPLGS